MLEYVMMGVALGITTVAVLISRRKVTTHKAVLVAAKYGLCLVALAIVGAGLAGVWE